MSKAERIDHLVTMIRANVYHCYSALMTDSWGYLEQAKVLANDGCFVSEDTTEAMGLEKAANELRKLALEIEIVRDQMLANYKTTKIHITTGEQNAAQSFRQ